MHHLSFDTFRIYLKFIHWRTSKAYRKLTIIHISENITQELFPQGEHAGSCVADKWRLDLGYHYPTALAPFPRMSFLVPCYKAAWWVPGLASMKIFSGGIYTFTMYHVGYWKKSSRRVRMARNKSSIQGSYISLEREVRERSTKHLAHPQSPLVPAQRSL